MSTQPKVIIQSLITKTQADKDYEHLFGDNSIQRLIDQTTKESKELANKILNRPTNDKQ